MDGAAIPTHLSSSGWSPCIKLVHSKMKAGRKINWGGPVGQRHLVLRFFCPTPLLSYGFFSPTGFLLLVFNSSPTALMKKGSLVLVLHQWLGPLVLTLFNHIDPLVLRGFGSNGSLVLPSQKCLVSVVLRTEKVHQSYVSSNVGLCSQESSK